MGLSGFGVDIDDQLEAIFNVIKSSLAFNNGDVLPIQSQHESKHKAQLTQELKNYILLFNMKRQMSAPAFTITNQLNMER